MRAIVWVFRLYVSLPSTASRVRARPPTRRSGREEQKRAGDGPLESSFRSRGPYPLARARATPLPRNLGEGNAPYPSQGSTRDTLRLDLNAPYRAGRLQSREALPDDGSARGRTD